MPESPKLDLSLEWTGVALIVGFGVIVTPSVVFVSVWLLSHQLQFAEATTFELVASGLSLLIGLLVLRISIRELAGGVGVRFDEQGVHRGATTIRWDEVEALEAPQFGLLDVVGGGKRLRLRTYLYRQRRQLLTFIAEKTGKTAPELGNSL